MKRLRLERKYIDEVPCSSEQTGAYCVELISAGSNKIEVIKAIREFAGLSLSDSKTIADNCPKIIKANISETEAQKIKLNIEKYGAVARIKSV